MTLPVFVQLLSFGLSHGTLETLLRLLFLLYGGVKQLFGILLAHAFLAVLLLLLFVVLLVLLPLVLLFILVLVVLVIFVTLLTTALLLLLLLELVLA